MTVTDIVEGGGNLFVSFSSVVGRGVGAWKSKEYPRYKLHYDVELDIDRSVEDAASISRETECKIEIEDGAVILTGCIESVEDDDTAFLRLAQDCLIMVEFSSANFTAHDWITIKVDPADLSLHVIGA